MPGPIIELGYDTGAVAQGTSAANKAMESTEKQAVKTQEAIEKSSESTARGILRVVDSSKRSVQSLLAQAERRVAAQRSPDAALKTRQERELKASAGDPGARARFESIHIEERQLLKQREMNALLAVAQKASQQAAKETLAFDAALTRLNRSQQQAKQVAFDKSLEAASRASRQAAKDADDFQRALARVNKEQRDLRTNTVSAVERKTASLDTPVRRLNVERTADLSKVAGDPAAVERVTAAYTRLIAAEKQQLALRTADEFNRVGRALTVGVTLPLVAAAGAALTFSERFNRASASLSLMLGGANEANQFLGKLQAFALSTPFEFAELVPAAQRLKALGFEAKTLIPIMRSVGEATAGVGGDSQTFDRITLALGQIQSKGRVMAQEMNQLTEALVPAWEILAKKIGVGVPEAMKLVEKGAVSASVAVPAILQGMLQRFSGQLNKQNELLSGQFSNLKDKLGFLLRDVGQALTPLASSVVQFGLQATGALSSVVRVFSELPAPIRNTTLGLVGLLAAIGPVTTVASGAFRALTLLFGVQAGGGLVGAIGILRALPTALQSITAYATGTSLALTALETRMLFLGKAGLVVGAAFGGFKLGEWINDVTNWGDKIAAAGNNVMALSGALVGASKLTSWMNLGVDFKFGRQTKEAADSTKDLEFQANKAYETLKKQGIVLPRNGQGLAEWRDQLMQTAESLNAINDMAQKTGSGDTGAEERQKRIAEAVKRTAEILRKAQLGELSGLPKIREEYRQYREELQLTEQEIRKLSGADRLKALSANSNLAAAELADSRAFLSKQAEEAKKRVTDSGRKNVEADLKLAAEESDTKLGYIATEFQRSLEADNKIRDLRIKNAQDEFALQDQVINARHDRELRGLQAINAVTVEQKIAVEQRKAQIEEQYLQETLAYKREILKADTIVELTKAGDDAAQRLEIQRKYVIAYKALTLGTQAEIDAARENAEIQSAQIAQDANQKTFDKFKSQAEGVFDALIRSSTNGWSAIGNALKTALLTAIKDVVSSQVARLLFGLTTGQSVQFAGAGGGGKSAGGLGGVLGGLLGLGGVPVFGNSSVLGGPGGTSGFSGAVGGTAQGTAGSALSGAGLVGGFKAQVASYQNLLTQLGNLGAGKGMIAKGITGVKGGGLLLGGGLLALDGVRRGGLVGLGETTAGGALIGAKFGGPVGALIGGAIGFGVGLFGLFRTKAEDKIVKRVRETYGFDIEKSFAKNQLLPIIKQQFGGDIEMGLRSQPVRDLIELYAMSRGLNTKGIVARATASVFASRGGSFQQVPTFQNGAQVLAGATASAPASNTIVVQLDGKATTAVLQGQQVQVMQDQPRAVSRAADAGSAQRASRDAAASAMFPNAVIA